MDKAKLTTHKIPTSIIILVLVTSAVAIAGILHVRSAPGLTVTVATPQATYQLRENVNVYGNLTENGSPTTDALVAVGIDNPRGDPFMLRTISMGNLTEQWFVNITEARVVDYYDNPVEKAEVNSVTYLNVTILNNLGNPQTVFLGVTVCDSSLIPLTAVQNSVLIPAGGQTSVQSSFYIPEWASRGTAYVFLSVYSGPLKLGGFPYVPEKTVQFCITQNIESDPPYSPPKSSYTTSLGEYNLTFQVPPDRYTLPGNYTVYVTGRKDPLSRVTSVTTFEVQDVPSPPQASFTYRPLQPYANMTVTLDASSSSAEGYNDTIIRYAWKINDPYNPEQIIKEGNYTHPPSPLAYHTFEYGGTYTVELNVTDNEGLWSTTSKPVIVYPEFGPTANFTWSPLIGVINQTVTFNATSSKLGWSALTQSYSPIQTYIWNFSDGTGEIPVSNPIIGHMFTSPGNYSVKLRVIDAVGRNNSISYVVQVLNITAKYCDVVEDGIINMQDIYAAILAFMATPEDPRWNPRADVIPDGTINMQDIYQIILRFMEDP